MSFLAPLAFALLGLSLPLVLLYFLKVRRRDQRVPSLLFWETTLHDRQASAFFQRLQRDPLLVLQLLALLALTLALARPALTIMGHGARKVAIVLDASASMKSRDGGAPRFAAARAEAAALAWRPARTPGSWRPCRGIATGRWRASARPRPVICPTACPRR
jgi:hypothetical protein